MSEEFHTSFIPKRVDAAPSRRASSVTLPTFIGILALVLSILAAAGAFGYQKILQGSIARKQGQLEDARAAFDPELVRELERLDARLTMSQELLNTHRSPSGLFDFLEDFTLQSVQFTSFELTVSPAGDIQLAMEGEAPDFASIALQSEEFGNDPRIENPIFSDLAVSDTGTVTFTFSGAIDPSVLAYDASAPVEAAPPEPVISESGEATSTDDL